MNFNIVEGMVVNFDDIYEDFVQDYIFSTELKNKEIRRKYGLSYSEFKELSDKAKEDYDLKRRPINLMVDSKHYYACNKGFIIQKTIDNNSNYIGWVKSEDVAIEIVERCKQVSWDISACKKIVKELKKTCLS